MANVLVTGGAGYVGSHLLYPLIEAGHRPVVFDNLSRGFTQLVDQHRAPLAVGHLNDRAHLRAVLERYHVDAIFH